MASVLPHPGVMKTGSPSGGSFIAVSLRALPHYERAVLNPPLSEGGPGGVDGAIRSVLGHRYRSDFARPERSNSISKAAAHAPPLALAC